MKRKSLPHTLDFPSNKSRRLDVKLVERMQDDSMAQVPLLLPLQADVGNCKVQTSVNLVDNWRDKAMVLSNLPDSPLSLLKAPVLPELPTIVLDSELIPGIRDHLYWPGMSKTTKSVEDNMDSDNSEASSNCLAVVPWVTPQPTIYCPQPAGSMEAMEAEEQADMMDTEDLSTSSNADAAINLNEMLQGWQERQQHCIEPQHFQNITSTVYW